MPQDQDLLFSLEAALAVGDRAAFRSEALATLAALPVEMRGPGADYRACAVIWRRHFHPPANMPRTIGAGSRVGLDRLAEYGA